MRREVAHGDSPPAVQSQSQPQSQWAVPCRAVVLSSERAWMYGQRAPKQLSRTPARFSIERNSSALGFWRSTCAPRRVVQGGLGEREDRYLRQSVLGALRGAAGA